MGDADSRHYLIPVHIDWFWSWIEAKEDLSTCGAEWKVWRVAQWGVQEESAEVRLSGPRWRSIQWLNAFLRELVQLPAGLARASKLSRAGDDNRFSTLGDRLTVGRGLHRYRGSLIRGQMVLRLRVQEGAEMALFRCLPDTDIALRSNDHGYRRAWPDHRRYESFRHLMGAGLEKRTSHSFGWMILAWLRQLLSYFEFLILACFDYIVTSTLMLPCSQ